MALTETQVEDKIEVVGDHKHVQVRTATVIARDGTEISRAFSRHVLSCSTKSGDTWADTDISDQSTEVQAICSAVWTERSEDCIPDSYGCTNQPVTTNLKEFIMGKTEKNPTITVNDKEYEIEGMTDQQKTMINHITDLDRKISTTQFNLDQLGIGREAFVKMLATSLEEPPVEEAA